MRKADLRAMEFALLELVPVGGGEGYRGLFIRRTGIEDQGDMPGADFAHEAYGVLRHLAWKYRAERGAEMLEHLENSMELVADRVKARPGVNPDDVDGVLACLKADRCGCVRCRYGV